MFKKDTEGKTIRDQEFFSTIGRMGGQKNKRNHASDPYWFNKMGLKGGAKMKERGFDFYSRIGKMSKKGREEASLKRQS